MTSTKDIRAAAYEVYRADAAMRETKIFMGIIKAAKEGRVLIFSKQLGGLMRSDMINDDVRSEGFRELMLNAAKYGKLFIKCAKCGRLNEGLLVINDELSQLCIECAQWEVAE